MDGQDNVSYGMYDTVVLYRKYILGG